MTLIPTQSNGTDSPLSSWEEPNTAQPKLPQQRTPVAVAEGDGIGPEIMKAVLAVLEAAQAPIEPHPIQLGEQVYLSGNTSGITEEAWDTVRKTGVLLKAPITTPRGGGYKSLNVTLRTRKTPTAALSTSRPKRSPSVSS